MKFILGKKLGMSQLFSDEGNVVPVTVIEVEPCVVTQVRTKETDGYEAVQLGCGSRKAKNVSKAVNGHLSKIKDSKIKLEDKHTVGLLREFRTDATELKTGDVLDVSVFEEGDKVIISSVSKGKGFQGVVKRHHFAGGPASHGHRHVLRTPGSIGCRFPQHTRKGVRMAGHTGTDRVTIRGLKVAKIDTENNLLVIKGAISGHRGSIVEIRSVVKLSKKVK